MKIIFDRSAFHNHFDLIKSSRLPQLTQEDKITVYHTAQFLDETVHMADSKRQDRKDELKRQWPFLQSICIRAAFRESILSSLLKSCPKHLSEHAS
jgi:hypothetical protein